MSTSSVPRELQAVTSFLILSKPGLVICPTVLFPESRKRRKTVVRPTGLYFLWTKRPAALLPLVGRVLKTFILQIVSKLKPKNEMALLLIEPPG